jgi:hypothetical protein
LSWEGSDQAPFSGTAGRRDRAFLINDAGRVVSKINQYLFANETTRTLIAPDFAADVNGAGLSVVRFWEQVSELFTCGQWVWIQVDRGAPDKDPETGQPRPRSLAAREAAGDKVRWIVWQSTDVVDWAFDAQGRLLWLLTEESLYDNADPMAEPSAAKTRTLWRRGTSGAGATWQRYSGEGEKVVLVAAGDISTQAVPFVLLGQPSQLPWWYDDVEMIQAAELNLDSLHYENLVKTVYPQLVISASMLNNLRVKLQERTNADGTTTDELVRELIRGLDRPFVEASEDKGLTRYLQPSAADLTALPTERTRLQRALFDMVGLALFNRESRQVQSAEAKQFDHLDTEATLQNRALLLQETETRLVALSQEIDKTFAGYVPAWPRRFDIPNTKEDSGTLESIANTPDLTPTMRRQVLKAITRVIDGIERIEPEDRQAIDDEIAALSDAEPVPPTPPAPQRTAPQK